MAEIVRKLHAAGEAGLDFESLFSLPCPRYDIVITFLALLELLRMGRVRVEQAGLYLSIRLFSIEMGVSLVPSESGEAKEVAPVL
jgi:chromatin segregation and condensation protein Rec8/ScpA/Scc1 (kleisin family)